jgi:chromosome segregation protein
VQSLVVPVASADDLAQLAVPDPSSVEQAIERFEDLAKRRSELEAERQRLAGQRARVERRIGELEAEGDVPTAEALGEARTLREALWQDLRPRLLGEPLPADPASDIAGYEEAVAKADVLADRRQAEADRIADFRKLGSERGELDDELAANAKVLAELEAQGRKAEADWAALWSPSQLTPKHPREMRGWLQARSEILHLLARCAASRRALRRSTADSPTRRSGCANWRTVSASRVSHRLNC